MLDPLRAGRQRDDRHVAQHLRPHPAEADDHVRMIGPWFVGRDHGQLTRHAQVDPQVQRLVQVAEQVRRWMGERFEPKEVATEKVTEKIEQTESVKQVEKARRSLREEARQRIEKHRQQRQQPRHSRGIGH